jgi:ABC-2 type transport system permease protein
MTPPDYDSAARPARAIEELRHVLASGPLLLALTVRNVTVRYKRSWFGVAWTMAQPAIMLLTLTVVFARAFAPEASSYALYLAPGLILWQFFAQTTSVIVAEVAAGVELWRRVRMPRTALAMATAGSGMLNLALAMVALIGLAVALRAPVGPALLTLPLVAILTAVFALGIGLTVAAAAIYFPDTAELYQALLIPWMFITPVIYPRGILPLQVDHVLALNPMAIFVDAFRRPFVDHAAASPATLGLMAGMACLSLTLGWLIYTRCADDIPSRG